MMSAQEKLSLRAINTIRFLSADAIQKANSGHPGLPLGTAAAAYLIWTKHLRHNPQNPDWINRDRFVLSGGHGSMLLYSLLHLTGYAVTLDDLKNFRQWESITPGHPEFGLTPGVETTTGPLGQGFGNAVGMAVGEAHLAARFNRGDHKIIDHYIYAIVTDGDLMEGVASEAASLAGHLKLGKLIFIYDDNHISIDGSTDVTFTEDRVARFEAYGWHTQKVADGNDLEALDGAIEAAKLDPRPSIIAARTIIGYGLPTKAGTAKAHGEPPGEEELNGAKTNAGWPLEPAFTIPEDVLDHFRQAVDQGQNLEEEWETLLEEYTKQQPQLGAEISRIVSGKLPDGWDAGLKLFPADAKGMATRAASGKVINALAPNLPDLIGGSADLAPSTKTWIEGSPAFGEGAYDGRNFHFGVREHGMAALVNGMALYPGIIPYGATFLVFSDYMRGAMRVAALSHIKGIWVFTHDSVGLGEDGPTHQPVEHIAALRAMPNQIVIRPADANETIEAWKAAIQNESGPAALLFSRQSVPTLDRSELAAASGLHKGAYILADLGDGEPDVILIGTGSEVNLIVEAGKILHEQGKAVRLVSMPSWELFEAQDQAYKDTVFPREITARLAVEAGISMGWEKYVGPNGKVIGVDKYGASAPANVVFEKYGFTVENVVAEANRLIEK
jgi:transketolase